MSRTLSNAEAHVSSISSQHPPTLIPIGSSAHHHKLVAAVADIQNPSHLRDLIPHHDVVLHTAGPFQRVPDPTLVLAEAIRAGVHYVDVCDDSDHATACKALHAKAELAGSTCLISTGIYPGVSNLMAAETVHRLRPERPYQVQLFYHTAGSGGIGPTVLASTFLLLSEQAIVYDAKQGRRKGNPGGEVEVVDFGGKIGKQAVYLLNLPEVESLHSCIFRDGHGGVSAKFSTAPGLWNWLLRAMARWIPAEVLQDRRGMLALARVSMPVVRLVDKLSGARTGIVAVGKGVEGGEVRIVYEHERLDQCVGEAVAAFVGELCQGGLDGGVFWPEDLPNDVRNRVLHNAIKRTVRWEVESKRVGAVKLT